MKVHKLLITALQTFYIDLYLESLTFLFTYQQILFENSSQTLCAVNVYFVDIFTTCERIYGCL